MVLFLTTFILLFSLSSCNSSDKLVNSINSSGEYINNFSYPDGRFVYEVDIVTGRESDRNYNILRHAGTMYALATYYLNYRNDKSLEVLEKATEFLKYCCIKPVTGNDGLLAIWSLRSINNSMPYDQLKLGGTGLGLVALLSMEKISPGTTDPDTLRKLGDFILYMQKEDGSFYSKYIPSTVGRDDSWTSLYYPGEAALGLVMLYEYDKQPKWFNHAVKVLTYLAKLRKNDTTVPPDHWALLATAKIFEIAEKEKMEVPDEILISHGKQIVNGILRGIPNIPEDSYEFGAMTPDGRTTPTSTRLEGIIAFSRVLDKNDSEMKKRISKASANGINFLINAQIKEGRFKGGFPPRIIENIDSLERSSRRYTVIRIDYVQHALSALIDYKIVYGKLR